MDDNQKTHLCCGADILLTGLYRKVGGEAICPVCGGRMTKARVEKLRGLLESVHSG